MSITIADIARSIGVHQSTVSMVLNNSRSTIRISDRTREKILQAAKEMSYRPNYLSKALIGGKSMTIGLVINPIMLATPIHAQRIAAIEKAAQDSGYLIYIVGKPYQNKIEPIQSLLDRRVDGLIVYFATEPSYEIVDFLNKQTLPIVYIDWAPKGCSRQIKINRGMGIEQIAKHLVKLGHRHIRYVPQVYDLEHPEGKLNFYQKSFEENGIHLMVDPEFSISSPEKFEKESHEIVNRLISLKRLPTALIMANDYMAQAAIAALQDAGIKVPGQVSVVGFDDLDFASLVRPALTTVRQPIEGSSRAFEVLETLMKDPVAQVEVTSLPCELIVRQSTGPAAPTAE